MEYVFEPLKTKRAFEEAVSQIASSIRAGDLRIGTRLPSERDLAEQMRISRPTVREAIRILSEAGVVEVRPGGGGGIYVAMDYVPLALLPTGLDMRASEIAGVLEARRMIEPRVAQLAAIHGDEAAFEAIGATVEQQRKLAVENWVDERREQFLQLDSQFHALIARATKNPTVVRIMASLLRDLESGRYVANLQVVPEWSIDIHERTLAAIRSGNMERIEIVMDEHLGITERFWEETTGRSLRPQIPAFLQPLADRSVK